MSSRITPIILVVVALLFVATSSLFTVQQTQLAIRTQFGEIQGSDYGPGLHMKWPFIDQVARFERRVVTQNYVGETFLTNENRGLLVDFYVKWRVADAAKYFRATGGNEDAAGQRLADIVKDGIKNAVAQRTLQEVVTAERAAVTGEMFGRASEAVNEFGIELMDVRVQRIDLPDDVAARVYDNMKQNFEKQARQLRGEGEKDNQRIKAEADRKRTEILSAAARDALRIRGEGDAIAAATYAKAYERNPEFYAFYRSMQAYKTAIGKEGDVIVVSPDSEFFKYFKESAPGNR
ncbi:MAG TPA: protease modulator HflC [Steroidobacteraceae bacterium]|nr:protease modulator HflC [Steroidobacteraceae bacterium]HNS28813.1 protease modulator HflC [Steroidobacteraceae bacterium]